VAYNAAVAALHFARIALLVSILAYVAVLTAGLFGVFNGEGVLLLGWVASLAIAVTASACVVAQLVTYFRSRR
jgi:hypothetical protein